MSEALKRHKAIGEWVYHTAKRNQALYLTSKIDLATMDKLHKQMMAQAEVMRKEMFNGLTT